MAQSFTVSLKIDLKPSLYLVATPIGNLGDITIRALQTLVNVDYVYCEDTRMTKKLLGALNLKTEAKLGIYNDYADSSVRQKIMDLIQQGKSVALVSDAGMPLISDPGFKLVRDCQKNGLAVTVVPGANAALSALSLSGLPTDRFQFIGFIPNKEKARETILSEALLFDGVTISYETAPRLLKTVQAIADIQPNTNVVIVREITKKFEEVISGTAYQLCTTLPDLKGEIVLVFQGSTQEDTPPLDDMLRALMVDHSLKEAVQIVSEQTGQKKKEVYARALELKDE